MSKLADEQIAKYESNGFKRWTKGNMDRLYINTTQLGLEVDFYKSGNICSAKWQGESISHADGGRILSSKVWIDIATGELHVKTSFNPYSAMTVEEAARKFIESM